MDEMRVLVVDDDESIRSLIGTILRRRGFRVDIARNGAEALDLCARFHYVVMLLDLMMPRVNGHDVLAAMALLERDRRPIIIVLTAGAEPRQLSPDVVSATVRKPFDVELLGTMVAGLLSGAEPPVDACPPGSMNAGSRSIRGVKAN